MTASDERADVAATQALSYLGACAKANDDATAWAAWAHLQDRSAGMPHVAHSTQRAREDARFWAETAQPIELECYLLASADKLVENGDLIHGKQIKRLVAALWDRMSPEEQRAFLLYLQRKNQ